jgi:hypothetical protein
MPKLEKEGRQIVPKHLGGFSFLLTAEPKFQLPCSPPPTSFILPLFQTLTNLPRLASHYEEKISKGMPAKLLHAMQGSLRAYCCGVCLSALCRNERRGGRTRLDLSVCLHVLLVLCFGPVRATGCKHEERTGVSIHNQTNLQGGTYRTLLLKKSTV